MATVAEFLAGRYELGVRLGSGGMGDVYRAQDRLLERVVAVKVPTTTVTPASAERFKREAQAAARLNHPNIVGVYDWGGGTEPFIVMEFVEGRSLRAELRARGSLPPGEVAAVGAQIADALAHAHHHGVVHRDVKPSNVLLTPGGSVKVTDFGIAQSTSGEALTEPGVVLGTVGYLSPEQVAGLPADARSDVYSLGVVLTELLTGSRPTAEAPPPATELERVVAKARAADPNQRHQAAGDLRDALRDASERDATEREASAVPRRLVPPPRTAAIVDVPTAADTAGATALDVPRGDPTARVTGQAVTSVLPVAGAAVAATATGTTPPPPRPAAASRRFRRATSVSPKPVKPLKPPKIKRRAKSRAVASAPPRPPKPVRTWKLRHWLVILAAPLVLVVGGIAAYALLVDHPPQVAVPDVVDAERTAGATALRDAGFDVQSHWVDDPRPGGTIIAQDPDNGQQADRGTTVQLTLSRTRATVPDVTTLDVERAKSLLASKGLKNLTITPDYRSDIDAGVVVRTTPAAYVHASKTDPIEVVVAADPHVTVPSVVGLDQAAARTQLEQRGLVVATQSASSRTVIPGIVTKVSPGPDTTLQRGDKVTLTVSSGPKPVNVPNVVHRSRDDATGDLQDEGFVVSITTTPVTSGSDDDRVIAQSPVGGQAPEGSTVTLTVGVRTKR